MLVTKYYNYAFSLSNDDVIIHFHIVKWTTLGLFIRNSCGNLILYFITIAIYYLRQRLVIDFQ